jgi:hypothetical protein
MNNVQKHINSINKPSSRTFRSCRLITLTVEHRSYLSKCGHPTDQMKQSVNDSLVSGYGTARYVGNFLLPRSVLGTTLYPSQSVVGAILPVVKCPQYKFIH